jgi:putative ABC transport system permease protein
LLRDLRYAIRLMIKKPSFTLIAITTLVAGIGLNTAVFSLVNSVILRPLPYMDSDRLVQIWSREAREGGKNGTVSPADFLDWRIQAKNFERISGYNISIARMSTAEGAVKINGADVTGDFFETLGVTPQLGRTFSLDDENAERNRVVVIGHAFWQTRLDGKPEVIGQTLTLNDIPYTIVGVLRDDYRHPEPLFGETAEYWRPLTLREGAMRGSRYLRSIGRLKKGVTLEQAQSEMTLIAGHLAQAYPKYNANRGTAIVPLHNQFTGDIRLLLLVLQGAVAFVWLIACVNIANLLLTRVVTREQEIAIRTALGAGKSRIIRLLLTEVLVLAGLGCAAGLLFARWGVDFLVSFAPREYFRLTPVSLDGWAFLFAMLLSLLTVLLFGLAPALQAVKTNLNEALSGSTRATRGRSLRGSLVVAEIALALVLLIGAGLLLRSVAHQLNVALGFNAENLLTMQVELPERTGGDQITLFYDQLLSRLDNLPGVNSAAVTGNLPLTRLNSESTGITVIGQPEPKDGIPEMAFYRIISPGYFDTMGIRLSKGRIFNERDIWDSPPVAIVNETLVRRFLQGAEPLGREILPGLSPDDRPSRPREIVGVVADVRHAGLLVDTDPEMYIPHAQHPRGLMVLTVRTTGKPEEMAAAVQKTTWEIRKTVSLAQVRTMRQIIWELVARPRFNLLLLGSLAVVALILAAIGIYGVMSYTVAQATREIGIRLALGAQRADVMKLVMMRGIRWTSLGLVIGLACAYGLTWFMRSLLAGVVATDAVTFASVALMLAAVALMACWIPARRATRVDPMSALRHD